MGKAPAVGGDHGHDQQVAQQGDQHLSHPANTTAGTVYAVAACGTATNQQFEARTTRNGIHLLNRDPANAKCIEVALGIGPNVVQNNCDGTASATINGQSPGNVAGTNRQLWNLVMVTPGNSANGYSIRNVATNQCLRVVSGTSQHAACNTANSDQVWYLDGVSSQTINIYDANGTRLVRTDPNGNKTLTLDDTDLTLTNGPSPRPATTVSPVISSPCAPRRAVNGLLPTTRAPSHHHGVLGVTAHLPPPTLHPLRRPARLHQQPPPPTQRGFLGAIEDDSTGLVALGARHYDPSLAGFISVDPKVLLTFAPYSYGSWSPLVYSDPTGLYACRKCDGADNESDDPYDVDQGFVWAMEMGNLAHALIELDYIRRGHVATPEYVVRSGPQSGRKIDIVDFGTGEVWEIKSKRNILGQQSDAAKLEAILETSRELTGMHAGDSLFEYTIEGPFGISLTYGHSIGDFDGLITYSMTWKGRLPPLLEVKARTSEIRAQIKEEMAKPTPINWGTVGKAAGITVTAAVVAGVAIAAAPAVAGAVGAGAAAGVGVAVVAGGA